MNLHESLHLNCPYCDAPIEIEADPQLAGQRFIEDCAVCCSPIELALDVDADGQWHLIARRDSD